MKHDKGLLKCQREVILPSRLVQDIQSPSEGLGAKSSAHLSIFHSLFHSESRGMPYYYGHYGQEEEIQAEARRLGTFDSQRSSKRSNWPTSANSAPGLDWGGRR